MRRFYVQKHIVYHFSHDDYTKYYFFVKPHLCGVFVTP